MTSYLLSVHHDGSTDPTEMSPEEMQPIFEAVDAFNDEVKAAGKWVFGGGLHGPDASTVVDATGSETLVTDGLFAESKEYLGGFWVIRADDLDEAIDWAKRGSAACREKIEVRPFQDDDEA